MLVGAGSRQVCDDHTIGFPVGKRAGAVIGLARGEAPDGGGSRGDMQPGEPGAGAQRPVRRPGPDRSPVGPDRRPERARPAGDDRDHLLRRLLPLRPERSDLVGDRGRDLPSGRYDLPGAGGDRARRGAHPGRAVARPARSGGAPPHRADRRLARAVVRPVRGLADGRFRPSGIPQRHPRLGPARDPAMAARAAGDDRLHRLRARDPGHDLASAAAAKPARALERAGVRGDPRDRALGPRALPREDPGHPPRLGHLCDRDRIRRRGFRVERRAHGPAGAGERARLGPDLLVGARPLAAAGFSSPGSDARPAPALERADRPGPWPHRPARALFPAAAGAALAACRALLEQRQCLRADRGADVRADGQPAAAQRRQHRAVRRADALVRPPAGRDRLRERGCRDHLRRRLRLEHRDRGDARRDRLPGDGQARLQHPPDLRRGRGRGHARHPDPALDRDDHLRHHGRRAGHRPVHRRHRAGPAADPCLHGGRPGLVEAGRGRRTGGRGLQLARRSSPQRLAPCRSRS